MSTIASRSKLRVSSSSDRSVLPKMSLSNGSTRVHLTQALHQRLSLRFTRKVCLGYKYAIRKTDLFLGFVMLVKLV